MPEPINYVSRMRGFVIAELPGLPGQLVDLYTLLALARGLQTNLVDVHDAWSVWRNNNQPNHQSLVPFNELSREVQELDRKYMDGIHRAVEEYNASLLKDRQ